MAQKRDKDGDSATHPVAAAKKRPRVFKTSHFAKTAGRAGIANGELCEAANELSRGQGDDLGGKIWKKRLDKNRYRSIVISRAGNDWIFVYLFAKKDRGNIEPKELAAFKKLAKDYGAVNEARLAKLMRSGDLEEICNGNESN